MIRISLASGKTGPLLRAEGQATGDSGVELVRAVRCAMTGKPGLGLDLEALGAIDQNTVEFLADCGDDVVILAAPGYVSRWLDAVRRLRRMGPMSA